MSDDNSACSPEDESPFDESELDHIAVLARRLGLTDESFAVSRYNGPRVPLAHWWARNFITEEELATTKRGVTVKPNVPDIVAEALAEIEAKARATVAAQQEQDVDPMSYADNIDASMAASYEHHDIERALDASPVELPRSIYPTASARVRYALWLLGERTRELEHAKATYANRAQRAKEAERLVQGVSDAVVDALKAARLEGRADFVAMALQDDDGGVGASYREEKRLLDAANELANSRAGKRNAEMRQVHKALKLLKELAAGEEFAMKDAER